MSDDETTKAATIGADKEDDDASQFSLDWEPTKSPVKNSIAENVDASNDMKQETTKGEKKRDSSHADAKTETTASQTKKARLSASKETVAMDVGNKEMNEEAAHAFLVQTKGTPFDSEKRPFDFIVALLRCEAVARWKTVDVVAKHAEKNYQCYPKSKKTQNIETYFASSLLWEYFLKGMAEEKGSNLSAFFAPMLTLSFADTFEHKWEEMDHLWKFIAKVNTRGTGAAHPTKEEVQSHPFDIVIASFSAYSISQLSVPLQKDILVPLCQKVPERVINQLSSLMNPWLPDIGEKPVSKTQTIPAINLKVNMLTNQCHRSN